MRSSRQLLRSICIDRGLPDCQRVPGACRLGPVDRAMRPAVAGGPQCPGRGAGSSPSTGRRPRPPPRAGGQLRLIARRVSSSHRVCGCCCPAGKVHRNRRLASVRRPAMMRSRPPRMAGPRGGTATARAEGRPGAGPMWLMGPSRVETLSGTHGQSVILRKEVIQPQVPLRLPCYDLVPITSFTFGACPCGLSDFGCPPLWWLDGRCVQGSGTHSPRHC